MLSRNATFCLRTFVLLAAVSALAGCPCWGNPVVNQAFTVSVRTSTTHAPVRTAMVTVTYADGTVVPFELGPGTPDSPEALYDTSTNGGRGSGEHITVHVTADGFQTTDQGFDVPRDAGGCAASYVALVLLQAN